MTDHIAGSEIQHSPSFALTEIDRLSLPPHLYNELQVRFDKIQTATSHEELTRAQHYGQGVVRGLVIVQAVTTRQALDLEAILEAAANKRTEQLGGKF